MLDICPLVIRSSLGIKSCVVVNLFIISIFFLVADYYDLRFGIIPNKLSLSLLIYGFAFDLFLAILLDNSSIFFFSLVLTVLVGIIAFILWYIGFWGGGDFKLFIGLSLSLSILDLNFLNVSNADCFVLRSIIVDLNLPISNQFVFYPKVFSILLNGLLIAFLALLLILICHMIKSKQLKYNSLLFLFDFKSFFNQLTTKSVHIDNLSQGMVLDKYLFNNELIYHLINNFDDAYGVYDSDYGFYADESSVAEVFDDEPDAVETYGNLKAYKDENAFYFTSLNRIGLTEYDIEFIRDLYKKDLIKNPNFKIKKGIPFMPFLTLGYFGFLIFGDFISIISSLIKLLY